MLFDVSKIRISSRAAAERMLREGFPDSVAVISFHDPDDTPVDYSGGSDRVKYVPLGDFDRELPDALALARFICTVVKDGINILCQCEKGKNRSPACAAAIAQQFGRAGEVFLEDENYDPDMMIYYGLLDALEVVAEERNKQ